MSGAGESTFILRTDGGARGNPGPAGAAFVLEGPDGQIVCEGGRFIGETTNNVAEYEALVWGLEVARSVGAPRLVVKSDSELVVKQVRGEYRVRQEHLKPLHAKACSLLKEFAYSSVEHVPRSANAHADDLANRAMDCRGTVGDAPTPGTPFGQGSLFD